MDWKTISEEREQELHDSVVQRVAADRLTFPGNEYFPGQTYPSWRVHTNVPEPVMPVEHKWMGPLYADALVVDSERSNSPMVICEIETPRSLTMNALEKWKYLQDTCRTLYVYVPEGYARLAAELVYDFRMCFPTLLRTYGFDEAGELRYTCV